MISPGRAHVVSSCNEIWQRPQCFDDVYPLQQQHEMMPRVAQQRRVGYLAVVLLRYRLVELKQVYSVDALDQMVTEEVSCNRTRKSKRRMECYDL